MRDFEDNSRVDHELAFIKLKFVQVYSECYKCDLEKAVQTMKEIKKKLVKLNFK